jgi:predicted ABC-type sugar transport system permease subunit
LHVILAEDDNPYNIATLGDYLDLGELQSTIGDQVYVIPNDVNLEKYGSVVVYCVPFQAIFAIAPVK